MNAMKNIIYVNKNDSDIESDSQSENEIKTQICGVNKQVQKNSSPGKQISRTGLNGATKCSPKVASELSDNVPRKKRCIEKKLEQYKTVSTSDQMHSQKNSVCNVPVNLIFRNKQLRSFTQQALSDQQGVKIGDTNGFKFMHLNTSPFLFGEVYNFIQSSSFVDELRKELSQLQFYKKNCDLYQFVQSRDLQGEAGDSIKMFKKILVEKCIPWFRDVMHFPLTDEVDMTCSAYRYSDVLLCHDDQLSDRKIAFVYYLVPDWEKSDGGTLDLFHSEQGKPTCIATSLIPEWNKLVFFEVSQRSFHQVSEVVSEKLRLSINGWFHVKHAAPKVQNLSAEPLLLHTPRVFKGDIKQWIGDSYFESLTQKQIRKSFATRSEIELTSFLKVNKFNLVEKALRNTKESDWKVIGPVNKRHYKELIVMPPVVEECLDVLSCDQMSGILSKLTGLSFSEETGVIEKDSDDSDGSTTSDEDCPSLTKKYRLVVRQWTQGDYTLLHDSSEACFALDVMLYFANSGWSSSFGGHTSYIAKDDGSEILRVVPKKNSLALVYRDRETDKFVKYVNTRSSSADPASFFDIHFVFSE